MRLYVANATDQNWVVFFRPNINADGNFTPPHQKAIPAGRQEQLGGEMEEHQINTVLEQLYNFGLIAEMDVPNKLWGVHPLISSVGKPVQTRTIQVVRAHNTGMRIEEGRKRRELAAVAANEALTNVTVQAALPEPPEFGVELEQMDQMRDEKRIEEGYTIARDLSQVPAAKAKGKPGRPPKAK